MRQDGDNYDHHKQLDQREPSLRFTIAALLPGASRAPCPWRFFLGELPAPTSCRPGASAQIPARSQPLASKWVFAAPQVDPSHPLTIARDTRAASIPPDSRNAAMALKK